MRELPDPDCTDTLNVVLRHTYSPELVLAIQKQAYEDGLRDAAMLDNFAIAGVAAYKLTSTRDDLSTREVASFCYKFALSMWSERKTAMLTASQKEAP